MSDPISTEETERQYPITAPSDSISLEADVPAAPQGTLRRFRTFDSLRLRDFRIFFIGALISNLGSWMQTTALGWLVFDITNKSASLGLVNFLTGIPILLLGIFTGALADHMNRQKLLIYTQIVLMLQAGMFGYLASSGHVTMTWIYGLSLLGGLASAFMSPAWQAMTPDLVPRASLLNAIALNSAQFNAARFLGPMAAAAVVFVFSRSSSGGITEIFWVNAASFLFVIWSLTVIRPVQHQHAPGGESPVDRLLGGLRYAASHRRVRMNLVTVAILTIFGMPHATLLPAIAKQVLHLGASGYSGLLAANGAGALVGALAVASLPPTANRDKIVRLGFVSLAVTGALLGLSRSSALTTVVLVVMGALFLAVSASVNTNIQASVPPELRGRVMSLFVLSFMGMMPFGAIIFGTLGDLLSPPVAVYIGAAVLLLWGLNILVRPHLLCAGGPGGCD